MNVTDPDRTPDPQPAAVDEGHASAAQVEAAQTLPGCNRAEFVLEPGRPFRCATHRNYTVSEWTKRGCPVAAAVADAVVTAPGRPTE